MVLMPVQREVHEGLFGLVVERGADYKVLWEESSRAYSRGTFSEITAERARGMAWNLSWPIAWLHILRLFLLGFLSAHEHYITHCNRGPTSERLAPERGCGSLEALLLSESITEYNTNIIYNHLL